MIKIVISSIVLLLLYAWSDIISETLGGALYGKNNGFCVGGQAELECALSQNDSINTKKRFPFWSSIKSSSKPVAPKCGEEIMFMSQSKLQIVIKLLVYGIHKLVTPMDVFEDTLGNFSESPLRFQAHNSVRGIKICAKCEDFFSQQKHLVGFDDYCGENAYGYNETMTGILFLPTTSDKSLLKSSDMRTAIWMKGMVSTYAVSSLIPSNMFGWLSVPFETALAFIRGGMLATFDKSGNAVVNLLPAVMLASRGIAVIAPDYLGYGGNTLHRGTWIGRPYQTASIPLWLHSKNLIHEVSGGKTAISDKAYVAGASEGAVGVLFASRALHDIGADVAAYPGSVPSYDLAEAMMRRALRLLNGDWPLQYMGWIVYGTAPFVSSSPYHNIALNESFFSELGETKIVNVLNSGMGFRDMNDYLFSDLVLSSECLSPQNKELKGCPFFINRVLIQNFREVVDFDPFSNPEYYPCQSKNPAPELSSLCNAMSANDLNPLFETAQYPVNVCHSPSDMITRLDNSMLKHLNNRYVEMKPTFDQWADGEKSKGSDYGHKDSCFVCFMYSVLDILNVS